MSDEFPEPVTADLPVEIDPEQEVRRLSRRGFLVFGAGAAAAFGGWKWLIGQPLDNGILAPLRGVLGFNEGVMRKLYSPARLSPEFPASAIQPIKTNGRIGLAKAGELSENLLILTPDGNGQVLKYAELFKFERFEQTTEFKCVEGWSRILHFSGFRLSDFLSRVCPGIVTQYVELISADQKYKVGIEWEAAMHPQSLLCDAMNHAPLKPENGAPLRLAMPIKYGYKQIKNIGSIRLTNTRPGDYWAERGYDWYGGL